MLESLAPPMLQRSLAVAFVVGVILNAINQGDVIWSGGPVNWLKVVLTFVVPFFVSTFGAYSAGRIAPSD